MENRERERERERERTYNYLKTNSSITQLTNNDFRRLNINQKNNPIKVSIVVPIYNVESYIEQCLNSIINQTLKEIEIICFDDCGTDNSMQIVEEIAKTDKRIKIIDHTENKGIATSRNNGLKIAKGEYIGFVDLGDWVDLNFFEILYKKAIESRADIVKGNLKKVTRNKTTISKQNKKIKKSLVDFCLTAWITAIYKASIIKNNKISFANLTHGEDDVFLMNAKLHSKNILIVNDVFYYYLQRENSSSHEKTLNGLQSTIKCQNLQAEMLNFSNISKKEYLEYLNRFLCELYWYKIESIKSFIGSNISNLYLKESKYKNDFVNKLKLFLKKFFIEIKFMKYFWMNI